MKISDIINSLQNSLPQYNDPTGAPLFCTETTPLNWTTSDNLITVNFAAAPTLTQGIIYLLTNNADINSLYTASATAPAAGNQADQYNYFVNGNQIIFATPYFATAPTTLTIRTNIMIIAAINTPRVEDQTNLNSEKPFAALYVAYGDNISVRQSTTAISTEQESGGGWGQQDLMDRIEITLVCNTQQSLTTAADFAHNEMLVWLFAAITNQFYPLYGLTTAASQSNAVSLVSLATTSQNARAFFTYTFECLQTLTYFQDGTQPRYVPIAGLTQTTNQPSMLPSSTIQPLPEATNANAKPEFNAPDKS